MDNPTKSQIGYIISTSTEMNISQEKWDVTFHSAVDCKGTKRPIGCTVCDHDQESCETIDCALCNAKNGIPFEDGVNYEYPKN